MSDSFFIGTVARVHKLWRYSSLRETKHKSTIEEDVLKKLLAMDDDDLERLKFVDKVDIARIRRLKNGEDMTKDPMPEIGMMVSLDHTIYFHNPRNFRADEWILTEMDTPWAGDGRGVVFQRMYTRDGTLIATCVQEVSQLGTGLQSYPANRCRVLCACARLRVSCRMRSSSVFPPL